MILQDKGKQAVLSVVKTFDLSHCLFYIPVGLTGNGRNALNMKPSPNW
jgi:hypothetical protein